MDQRVVLPSSVGDAILDSGAPWGYLHARVVWYENYAVLVGGTVRETNGWQSQSQFVRSHNTGYCDTTTCWGVWYRVEPELHQYWIGAAARSVGLTPEGVRSLVPQGWRVPGPDPHFMLTLTVVEGESEWRGWIISNDFVRPVSLEFVDEASDPYASLRPGWPIDALSSDHVTLVGLGSIGSSALDALVDYGVQHFTLVDPDRLEQHNVVRHRLDATDIGRPKVAALTDRLKRKYQYLDIEALALDVIHDANIMRPIFRRTSLVLATPDGVAPRRVVGHLARWARVPIVLGAVLDDGGVGEVLRFRPGYATGCLQCHRAMLRETGGMDPEPTLDRGYGTGSTHRPMTAVTGDLALVGQIAAKVSIGTLLEAHGYPDQRLPGDHAVIGLRPAEDLAPPFKLAGAGAVEWSDLNGSRSQCPTCSLT